MKLAQTLSLKCSKMKKYTKIIKINKKSEIIRRIFQIS